MSGFPTTAKPRRSAASAKNEPPILSHRYFINNHADILCSVVILVCVASMWQRTQPLAVKFLWPNRTADFKVYDHVQYAPCRFDPLLMVTYTIAAIAIHSLVKTYLVDRWLRKVKLSWSSSLEANRIIQRTVFETAMICCALYVCSYVPNTALKPSARRLMTARGDLSLDVYSKFWYVFNMSYWVHWLSEIYFELYLVKTSGTARYDETCTLLAMSVSYLFVCCYAYVSKLWHLGACLLLANYVGNLPVHVARILTLLKVSLASDVTTALNVTCAATLLSGTAIVIGVVAANVGGSMGRLFFSRPSLHNAGPVAYLGAVLILQLVNTVLYWKMWRGKSDDTTDIAPRATIVTRSKAKSKKSQ